MIEMRAALDGGGTVIIVDGCPRELYLPDAKVRRTEERSLIERAEKQYDMWLDWEGPWAVATVIHTTDGPGAHRMVRPSKQQPTHRVKFVSDQGTEETWLLLVDSVSPGAAYAWTHAEWQDETGKYEDGGLWCQIEGAWHYRVPPPNNMTGVVTVEAIKRKVER